MDTGDVTRAFSGILGRVSGLLPLMQLESGEALPFSFLFLSAVLPVLKVLIICGIGLAFASEHVNVLTAPTRKSLSKLVFALFLPAIIFVDLGEAINLQRLLEWWFIPVNVILASLVGCLVGVLVAWATNCPPEYFRIVYVLAGIGNMGNMPLVLLSAVCSDARNPFGAKCLKEGTAYIAVGMWMAAIIMWGLVYNIVKPPEEWLPGYVRRSSEGSVRRRKALLLPSHLAEEDGGDMAMPHSPLLRSASETLRKTSELVLVHTPNKFAQWLKALHLYDIVRPPVLAAFLAIIFGIVPSIDHILFHPEGALRFVSDSLSILGQAMIPCILLVLGGSLVGGPGASELPNSTTLMLVLTRLVLMPAIGLGIVHAADHLGWLPPGNKMFRFVLLVQHTMPSSIQIGTACSLRGFGEKEVSAVLFWEHLSALLSMTCYLFLYMIYLFGV
eukprot:jgi/Mesen1/8996/ME000056S08403